MSDKEKLEALRLIVLDYIKASGALPAYIKRQFYERLESLEEKE